MNKKINIGDVVKLKSGGMPMTVIHLEDVSQMGDKRMVRLIWHDLKGEMRGDDVPAECLVVQPQ